MHGGMLILDHHLLFRTIGWRLSAWRITIDNSLRASTNHAAPYLVLHLTFLFLCILQALCVIANIANGSSAKDFVMRDEILLKRLMHYMMNDSVKLQMAATYCVSNLVWSTEDGAVDRQQKLRDLGVQKLLQSLLTTSDVNLFER